MLHQIGVGALGPVFRTYEPARDRLVAVKVFRLDITPEQAKSLADELSRAAEAGLFHPSIVEPLAAGIEGTVAYRAEEYVAAESLDVAMRHYAPATLDKVLPFITQLAGAIDFARAAGVGHGALHPRDVFVSPDEARATGFGVVDALERTGLRAPIRRPYSPPERIAGEKWGTPADVFSLAAIAFELLTGRRPSGTGDQIGSLAPPAAAPHADRLHEVLARAMHEHPAARYPTALAFAAALESGARAAGATVAPATAAASAGAAAAPPPERPAAVFEPARPPAAPEPAPAADESASSVLKRAPTVADRAPAVPDAAPPAPAPVFPPQPPHAAIEPDDIAAEREEDDAHWELTRHEARTVEPEVEAPATLFDDDQVEAAADDLALDAADLALGAGAARTGARDARFADGFGSRRPARFEREDRATLADEIPARGEADPRPSRTPALPIAVTLIVGLLLGFVAAYAVLSSGPADTATGGAAVESAATAAGTGGADAPASKAWSEQAVAQPKRPPGAPPDVPADAPAVGPGAASTSPATPVRSAPPAAAATSGRVIVRSTPAGASVTLNGRWRGRTPLTLEELAFGDYTLRIVQPGYEVARETFKLSAAQPSRTVSQRLRRSEPVGPGAAAPPRSAPQRTAPPVTRPDAPPFTGSVYVDSRPRGAKVFVDGKEFGTTPLRIPELAIGSRVVRLELADHRAWSSSVRITAGEERRVTGSLEPIR